MRTYKPSEQKAIAPKAWSMAIVTIDALELADLRTITNFLSSLDNAYNSIYAYLLIIEDIKGRYKVEHSDIQTAQLGSTLQMKPVINLPRIDNPSNIILDSHILQLTSIVIQSPGFWEFLGALNPLEVVRKYLNDRHERKKDNGYRSALDKHSRMIEIETKKIELVEKEVSLLRNIGVPEDQIREMVNSMVFRPLSELDTYQDKKIITTSTIRDKIE